MAPEEIVKRLRELSEYVEQSPPVHYEQAAAQSMCAAADLFDQQAKLLDEAERALEPFSVLLGNYSAQPDSMSLGCGFGVHGDVRFHFTVGDMRRAASTLAAIRALKGE